MKTPSTRFYLLIGAILVMLMSLPTTITENIRGSTIAFLTPLWKSLISVKETATISLHPSQELDKEIQRLRLENQLLHAKMTQLQHTANTPESPSLTIPGRVIFRSPSSWYSSLWINVGAANNPPNTKPVITKNSPVMLGESLIGVIDYVGSHQSRVRLITDSGLAPSVRAVRSGEQNKKYMAKGELHGSSQPLGRTKNHPLKGTGFNYDFADEKGEARDLRTGKVINDSSSKPVPLLKIGDLLVTTGMDGIFPEGLQVAEITKIYPLKEGDYYYDLEAEPTAGNLDDLSLIFVIPPLGYDPSDKPPILGNMK